MKKEIKTYPSLSGLSDDQAIDMLDKLKTHYGQPVLPLNQVCNAFDNWWTAIQDLERRTKEAEGKYHHGSAYVEHLGHIFTDIRKSALLFRLLYLGEELRTEMCPKHNGEMDIQIWVGFPNAGTCECNGTGWLPNK